MNSQTFSHYIMKLWVINLQFLNNKVKHVQLTHISYILCRLSEKHMVRKVIELVGYTINKVK